MRIIPPQAGQEYILEFESADEYQCFFDQAHEQGYFLLSVTDLPLHPVLRARCLGSPRTRKIKPDHFQREKHGVYRIEVPRSPSHSHGPSHTHAGQPLSTGEPAKEATATSGTVHDRIKGMSINEKATLAMKADFMERRVLMQENNLKINEFLLRNPRLSEQEIVWLARNSSLPMQNLLAIARHETWMRLVSVRSAVLMNPRTPAPMVVELIPAATAADLIKLHHSRELREDLRGAVAREIRRRGINPKRIVD